MTTNSIQKINDKLATIPPDSLRHQVLVALRQFRASWVNLGRLLNEMVYGGDYKEAGFADFEVYCARELGLKKPTVQKLMISYNYMRKYEGKRLAQLEDSEDSDLGTPDYQTVELLDRVRRRDAVPEEEMEEIHSRVFDDAGTDSEIDIRKELRQCLKPTATGADTIHSKRNDMAAILNAARALRKLLSTTKAVPGGLRERLEIALTELEALN